MNPSAALDLRDIHAAPPPAFWPPAPGWWLLAVVVVIALVVLATWLARRYRRHRHERQIMLEIERLSDSYKRENITEFVTEISTLLRRVAIRRYSRAEVASLTGSDWLRILDATGGAGGFADGVGQVLESGPYRPDLNDLPAEELLSLARRWISKNLAVAA